MGISIGRYSNMVLLALGVFVLVFGARGASAQSDECVYQSGDQYWFIRTFSEALIERDMGDMKIWSLSRKSKRCSKALLSEINDTQNILIGYKRGLDLMVHNLYYYADEFEKFTKPRIKLLLGMHFSSGTEALDWWLENQDYLRFSEKELRLLVDKRKRKMKEPVQELHLQVTMSAEKYWHLEGLGLLKGIKFGEVYVNGWWPNLATHSVYEKLRVPKSELNDRGVREKGYIMALEGHMRVLDFSSGKKEKEILSQLPRIVDENFDTSQSWIEWYEKSKDGLTLSKDGTKLVVK